jgi:hypothetical protein
MQPIRLVFMLLFVAATCLPSARAGTYRLTDGSQTTGEPVAFADTGVILRDPAGLNPRIPWARLTQDSLKQLAEEAKTPKDRAFVEPFIEDWSREQALLRPLEVVVPEFQQSEMDRKAEEARKKPTTGLLALFNSPLGVTLLVLAGLANLWAGFELAVFRNRPMGLGIGLGLVPLIGPLAFAFIPTQAPPPAPEEPEEVEIPPAEAVAAEAASEEAPASAAVAVPPPQTVTKKKGQAPTISMGAGATDIGLAGTAGAATVAAVPAAAEVPSQVQVFEKGKFIFNRRFFETKLPGFLRAVPRDEDKDLVVVIKALRGEFVGKRITSIDQSQLALQVFKGGATADEAIPFMEIQEVRIQPQDS